MGNIAEKVKKEKAEAKETTAKVERLFGAARKAVEHYATVSAEADSDAGRAYVGLGQSVAALWDYAKANDVDLRPLAARVGVQLSERAGRNSLSTLFAALQIRQKTGESEGTVKQAIAAYRCVHESGIDPAGLSRNMLRALPGVWNRRGAKNSAGRPTPAYLELVERCRKRELRDGASIRKAARSLGIDVPVKTPSGPSLSDVIAILRSAVYLAAGDGSKVDVLRKAYLAARVEVPFDVVKAKVLD